MQMTLHGRGWVRWDVGCTANTKTRQSVGIWGLTGQDLGPMAGEISPDIMFGEWRQKLARMGADGCRSVRMGAGGCMMHMQGGNVKQHKIFTNGCVVQYSITHDHGNKIRPTLALPKNEQRGQ